MEFIPSLFALKLYYPAVNSIDVSLVNSVIFTVTYINKYKNPMPKFQFPFPIENVCYLAVPNKISSATFKIPVLSYS